MCVILGINIQIGFERQSGFSCAISSLPSLSPSLPGMKVYVTDEKELIMEPSFKWAGNPNVTVAVKAFGLKATAQVLCFF